VSYICVRVFFIEGNLYLNYLFHFLNISFIVFSHLTIEKGTHFFSSSSNMFKKSSDREYKCIHYQKKKKKKKKQKLVQYISYKAVLSLPITIYNKIFLFNVVCMFYFLININITKIRTIRPYSTSYLIKI